MASIYTLTLSPSLDSATITPHIYPEGKLRCSAPVFEPGGGGINVAAPLPILAVKPPPYSLPGVPRGNILSLCWRMNRLP